jgi:putative ABC transport system ATP-binding protein
MMENNNLKPSNNDDEVRYASGAGKPAPDVADSENVAEQPTRPEMSKLDREELPTRPELPTVDREELPTRPELPTVNQAQELDEQPTLPEVEKVELEPEVEKVEPESDISEVDTKRVAVYEQPTVSQSLHDMSEETINMSGNAYALSGQKPVIAVRDLQKSYVLGGKSRVYALRGVSLDVYAGEFVAIMGPSGSGKSTFMNLLGCLDRPTNGEYWLDGKLVSKMSSDEQANIRNRLIGFVFQGFNLLGRATALKNAALPMVYAGVPRSERERRARKALKLVGLGSRINHKPTELSGGQQQRVAIARALVNGPSLLLADEPTGALDSKTGVEIMGILQALNEQGLTIVLVTHDQKIAQYAKRNVAFLDGRIVRDEPVTSPRSAADEWAAILAEENTHNGTTDHSVAVKEESV